MAAAFILLGRLFQPLKSYLSTMKFQWVDMVLIVLGCVGIYVSKLMNSQSVLMYNNQYGDYLWFFVGAISGIMASLLLGKKVHPTNA